VGKTCKEEKDRVLATVGARRVTGKKSSDLATLLSGNLHHAIVDPQVRLSCGGNDREKEGKDRMQTRTESITKGGFLGETKRGVVRC